MRRTPSSTTARSVRGANFLSKPVMLDDLARKLCEALAQTSTAGS